MKVKLILPALTEATSPLFRPIKYSLFPPLGLATLAAYLGPDDEAEIRDRAPAMRTTGGAHDRPDLRRISGLRHFAYAAGWKKFEPLWDAVIRAKRAGMMLPVLEAILSEFGSRSNRNGARRSVRASC